MEIVVIGFQAAKKGTERYLVMKEVDSLDEYTKNSVGLADNQILRRSVNDIRRSLKAAKHFQSASSVNVTNVSNNFEIPPEYRNSPNQNQITVQPGNFV